MHVGLAQLFRNWLSRPKVWLKIPGETTMRLKHTPMRETQQIFTHPTTKTLRRKKYLRTKMQTNGYSVKSTNMGSLNYSLSFGVTHSCTGALQLFWMNWKDRSYLGPQPNDSLVCWAWDQLTPMCIVPVLIHLMSVFRCIRPEIEFLYKCMN